MSDSAPASQPDSTATPLAQPSASNAPAGATSPAAPETAPVAAESPSAESAEAPKAKSPRQGVLVIHGIGQQQPFEALDTFVNGLRSRLPGIDVTHVRNPGETSVGHFIRLRGRCNIDVFEFYWAPHTAKKESLRIVLEWLYITGFTPLRRLAFNLSLLVQRAIDSAETKDESLTSHFAAILGVPQIRGLSWTRFLLQALWRFLVELFRIVLIAVAALALTAAASALISNTVSLTQKIPPLMRGAYRLLDDGINSATLCVFALCSVAMLALVLSIPEQARALERLWKLRPAEASSAGWSFVLLLGDTLWPVVRFSFTVGERLDNALDRCIELARSIFRRPAPPRTPEPQAPPVVAADELVPPHPPPPPATAPASPATPPSTDKESDRVTAGPNELVSWISKKISSARLSVADVQESKHRKRQWRANFLARIVFAALSCALLALISWLLTRLVTAQPVCVAGAYCLSDTASQLYETLGEQGRRDLLVIGGLLAAGALVKHVFVDYVADIALYTNTNAASPYAKARREIQHEGLQRLRWLLRHYESVAVVGHSLGSVIGYDLLNRLRDEAKLQDAVTANALGRQRSQRAQRNRAPPAATAGAESRPVTRTELSRLGTFITFGSPLNKVLYFFQAKTRPQETIRAHILFELNGFRRRPSTITTDPAIADGVFVGDRVMEPPPEHPCPLDALYWLNVHAPLDPISARLIYYDKVHELARWYALPGLCHTSYWYDPQFYDEVLAALDRRPRRSKLRENLF